MAIWVQKGDLRLQVALTDLHRYTGAFYWPQIRYADWETFATLRRQTAALGEWMPQEQRWLGLYFEQELLTPPVPPVSLRWIDDRVGWGVFAEEALPQTFFVAEYTGVLRKRKKSDRKNAYCFEYLIVPRPKSPYLIDAEEGGNVARYINHSKAGNLDCALATVDGVPHIVLHTARRIERGEQILYDYGPRYWKKRKELEIA